VDRTSRVPEAEECVENDPDRVLMSLTPRERQVALAVADGASNQQVAAALKMSTKTVECHLAHIYLKLNIGSRLQLAVALGAQSSTGLGSPWSSLSPAEREIADLVGEGLSNRAAAARLYLSPKSVEYYLGSIYRKLRITSRCQLLGVLADSHPTTVEATLAC
jgi:DNA-binding CsgD family transcriptional regulator